VAANYDNFTDYAEESCPTADTGGSTDEIKKSTLHAQLDALWVSRMERVEMGYFLVDEHYLRLNHMA